MPDEDPVILNDRHQIWNVFRCVCSTCKHFDSFEFKCPAFPGGIPDQLLEGTIVKHDILSEGQTGKTIFEARVYK